MIKKEIDRILDRELRYNKSVLYRLRRRLPQYSGAKGKNMVKTDVRGRSYYMLVEPGDSHRTYLGTADSREVQEIQELHFIEKAAGELEANIKRIETIGRLFRPFDPGTLNRSLPKAYRLSDRQLEQLVGQSKEKQWFEKTKRAKEEDIKKNGVRYPGGLIQGARDGTLMRSKSEVLIANEMLSRGIDFVYEAPLRVGKVILHPDFMFYSEKLGRVVIWEHAGLLADEGYRERFAKKVDVYLKGGYIPCLDVIFTFDTVSGVIDTGMVKKLLDEYCGEIEEAA